MVLDINKCFEKTDICDNNAACTNIPGGDQEVITVYVNQALLIRMGMVLIVLVRQH